MKLGQTDADTPVPAQVVELISNVAKQRYIMAFDMAGSARDEHGMVIMRVRDDGRLELIEARDFYL